MTTIRELFDAHQGRLVAKIDHYFDDYEPFLSHLRRDGLRILEIGVSGGGSLELWQNYFGPSAEVHGIDIDPATLDVCPDGAHVHIGSQDDTDFLADIVDQYGPFDLVLDDGSHLGAHQIASFEALYPTQPDDGIYLCEDTFTSYWPVYGGGLRRHDTFVEYAKSKVDELHAWWIDDTANPPTDFTAHTASVTFLSGAVVFVRGERKRPTYVTRIGPHVSEMSAAELHEAALRTVGGASADDFANPAS